MKNTKGTMAEWLRLIALLFIFVICIIWSNADKIITLVKGITL